MGSSGGGVFSNSSPTEVKSLIRKAEEETRTSEFETKLQGEINDLLATYNDRDEKLVRKRIDEVLNLASKEIEGSLETLFGGSVSKHTYVDGISDVDCLLLINRSELANQTPQEAIKYVADLLRNKLKNQAEVEASTLAVTVKYPDGIQLQFLPSLRLKDGFSIPSSNGDKWSAINPESFTNVLTKRNQECHNKLVPMIKLAKAINGQFPRDKQLSGYHIESLAAEAFKDYQGPVNAKDMLLHFFERSTDLVKEPIKDKTGQSSHVDEYLGTSNSPERQQASHLLNRIAKRMKNASGAESIKQWIELFGE